MQRSNPGSLCLLQALVPSEARVCWEYWGWGHSFSLKLFTGVIFLVCVQWALLGFPALHLRERQNQLDMVYVLVKLFICHSHWLEHWIYRRNCGTEEGSGGSWTAAVQLPCTGWARWMLPGEGRWPTRLGTMDCVQWSACSPVLSRNTWERGFWGILSCHLAEDTSLTVPL